MMSSRANKTFIEGIKELIEEYLNEKNWLVKENANVSKTFTGLVHYITLESLKKYSLEKVYKEESKWHVSGDVHIHDLSFASFIGYCAGWSIRSLLEKGLQTPTVVAKPAKHLDSAVDHIANFLCTAAHEWAGAQAFSKVDLYLAPFVKEDRLSNDYMKIKQAVQRLVFNLNFPSRVGSQTPFTNFTFVLDTVPEFLKETAVVGGQEKEPLEAYIDEALKVAEAFIDVFDEGDAIGQPFTFPIPTILVTKNFDWEEERWGELSYKIWKLASERGSWYFLNGVNGIDPRATLSMCCRLTIDKSRVFKLISRLNGGGLLLADLQAGLSNGKLKQRHMGGTWALPEETGSIGVVTINMSRLGYLAHGDEDKLFELFEKKLQVARKHLMNKRNRLEKILRESSIHLPVTKTYLGTYSKHFNTVGLTALPEFIMNFLQDPGIWSPELTRRDKNDIVSLYIKVLTYALKRIEEFEKEDNALYNLEETPAEGAGTRLARIDRRVFNKAIKEGKFFIPEWNNTPFYSNSIVPYYANIPLYRRIDIEAEVQRYFTGGVMMHIFLGEPAEPEALKKLCYRIIHNTKIVYFSFTPTQSICRNCGWRGIGIYWRCPKCNHETDIWSRIVGYYRPLKRWNSGRFADFMRRKMYANNDVKVTAGS